MSRSTRSSVQLANLDLNLLVSLDVLLQERSVTRAATRLGLSQPTLSTTLGRLRRYFDDELLTRVGNRYELTPLGADLIVRTADAVSAVERLFDRKPQFVPEESDREFAVLASDYVITVFGQPLAVALRKRAPRTSLRLEQMTGVLDARSEALRAVDGVVLPHGFLSQLPYVDLFTDRWVFVVSADNDVVGDRLTLDELRVMPVVLSRWQRPLIDSPVVRQLAMLGLELRVVIAAESFLAIPFLISGTDRVGLLQERLARRLACTAGIRIVQCPFDAPHVMALWWHPMHDRDAGHRWLRTVFSDVAHEMSTG